MPDDIQKEDITLDQLQSDLDSVTTNYKRALADFENYKRRKEAENKELVEFAREVAVAKLLPSLDSLSQALKHMPECPDEAVVSPFMGSFEANAADKSANYISDFGKLYKNWQIGINGIIIQLDQALTELGVKKIEALGKKFDPNFHEAIREVESDNEDGVITEELQTGYEINGKVVRPSQVVISKKK